jgi:hypothetical protein
LSLLGASSSDVDDSSELELSGFVAAGFLPGVDFLAVPFNLG